MQALIVAGGLATRLGAAASRAPKAMLDVGGRPFLAHQLELLRRNGIHDIILCVGHLSACIKDYLGDGRSLGVRARYSDEGAALMGTAGALKKAEPLVDDRFFVLDGDAYLPLDYPEVMARFQRLGLPALMVVYENHGLYDASNAAVAGDKIAAYDRGRKAGDFVHVHAGLSVLSRGALALIPSDRPSPQDVLWSGLIAQGRLAAFVTRQRFYEIGSPAGLEEFRRYAAESRLGA